MSLSHCWLVAVAGLITSAATGPNFLQVQLASVADPAAQAVIAALLTRLERLEQQQPSAHMSSSGATAKVDSHPWGPVNARDYGAKGSCFHPGFYNGTNCLDCLQCQTDDAPALQAAIDAAQLAGRALFVPAGVYLVNSTLRVRCSGTKRGLSSPSLMCDGVVNETARYHPLRMVGEGMERTVIMAGAAMRAVLELQAPAVDHGGASSAHTVVHNQTGLHWVEDIHFDAQQQANYSVLSYSIANSRFRECSRHRLVFCPHSDDASFTVPYRWAWRHKCASVWLPPPRGLD
jgi:hypothetical protein